LYLRGRKYSECVEKCMMKNFVICTQNSNTVTKRRKIRWAGYVAQMGRSDIHIKSSLENLRRRKPGRRRCKWEDIIRMDRRETG